MGKRISVIDIAKGIGIICVVIGHVECLQYSFLKPFIYQFHIPLFFFLSGLFYKSSDTVANFVSKKFTTLYLPAIIVNTVFLVLFAAEELAIGNPLVFTDLFKHWIKVLLGIAVTPMGGATWFLYVLFRAYILLFIIDKLTTKYAATHKPILFGAIILCFSICGFILSLPFRLERDFIALLFIYMGKECGKIKIWDTIGSFKDYLVLLFCLLSMTIVYVISKSNNVDISQSQFGCPVLMILSSIIGIIAILTLSEIINRFWHSLTNLLTFIGEKSIRVLLWHFLVFHIITIIQVIIYREPLYNITDFPTHISTGIWFWIYCISGVLIPLLFPKRKKI